MATYQSADLRLYVQQNLRGKVTTFDDPGGGWHMNFKPRTYRQHLATMKLSVETAALPDGREALKFKIYDYTDVIRAMPVSDRWGLIYRINHDRKISIDIFTDRFDRERVIVNGTIATDRSEGFACYIVKNVSITFLIDADDALHPMGIRPFIEDLATASLTPVVISICSIGS